MTPTVWNEIQFSNHVVQIVSLEPNRFQESTSVMQEGFFPFENISLGCDVASNAAACDELAKLSVAIAEDGISVIAVVKETNKIIGVSFNKIQKLGGSDEPSFFAKFRDEYCKEDNSIALINFMLDLDSQVNLFEMFNVECLAELTFLAVLPEWGGKGIGKALIDGSLDLVRSLSTKNADSAFVPKQVTCLATSKFSYLIFKKCGFREVFKKEFSDYDFNGKWKFSEKVNCKVHDKGLILMAKEL